MKRKNIAVIGGQWGDEGKGKIIDVLSRKADIVVRGTGGANAGHTIRVGAKKYVLHLVPSGIVRRDTMNVIGNGMVIDPHALSDELSMLSTGGIDYRERLQISLSAKLILPQHFLIEALHESGNGSVGSTKRGVGPCYADHVARIGCLLNDIFNPKVFREKLERNLEDKRVIFAHYGRRLIRRLLAHMGLERCYAADGFLDVNEIIAMYREYARPFQDLIRDTDFYLRKQWGRKSMLFEGAQGMYLSIDYGTYPFVTSSDPGIEGLMKGGGLPVSAAEEVFVVMKAPYETRVGMGAFPTEMGGKRMDEWCKRTIPPNQEPEWPAPDINSANALEQGIAVLKRGAEFGATTGRRRRCGWFDAVLARHAMEINGGRIILTKLDVFNGCKRLKICTHYVYEGPTICWGNLVLRKGTAVHHAIPHNEVLRYCNPQYMEVPGWNADISKLWRWRQLPARCKRYVDRIAELSGAKIAGLSVGPDRDAMIWL